MSAPWGGGRDAQAPPGFVQVPPLGGEDFNSTCGPFWIKAEDGHMVGAFRVERRHCNPLGTCHGGMLATFCDLHMPLAAQFENSFGAIILPTITLSLDYLAPTPNGAWVEARSQIMKVTRGMVFAHETVLADGQPVAFARGVFKIPKPVEGMVDTGAALRRLLEQPGR